MTPTTTDRRPTDALDIFRRHGYQLHAYRRVGDVDHGAEFLCVVTMLGVGYSRTDPHTVVYVDLSRDEHLSPVAWRNDLSGAIAVLAAGMPA